VWDKGRAELARQTIETLLQTLIEIARRRIG